VGDTGADASGLSLAAGAEMYSVDEQDYLARR